MSNLPSFSRYQIICVSQFLFSQLMMSSILDDVINFKIYFQSSPQAMADRGNRGQEKQWLTGGKEGKREYISLNILKTKKAF